MSSGGQMGYWAIVQPSKVIAYNLCTFITKYKNKIFGPGSRVLSSGLSCCSTDGLFMSTCDLHRALLSLRGRQAGPRTEGGRSRTQQPSRAAPGFSPLPEPALFLRFVFVSCFVFHYIRYTDLASDQFIFSLENSLSPLHFYCIALSSHSLSLSMTSHSQPHKTALRFSCSLINE